MKNYTIKLSVILLAVFSFASCSSELEPVDSFLIDFPSQNLASDITNIGVENISVWMPFDATQRAINPEARTGEDFELRHITSILSDFSDNTAFSFELINNSELDIFIENESLRSGIITLDQDFFANGASSGNSVIKNINMVFNSNVTGVHVFDIIIRTNNNTTLTIKYRVVVN